MLQGVRELIPYFVPDKIGRGLPDTLRDVAICKKLGTPCVYCAEQYGLVYCFVCSRQRGRLQLLCHPGGFMAFVDKTS